MPGIPVPVSEFPVHVPVPNKYARIPVPAIYPGTGSAQPLNYTLLKNLPPTIHIQEHLIKRKLKALTAK